jgi:phenazine biosynthesis protein phzE
VVSAGTVIGRLSAANPEPFAVLYRPHVSTDTVEVLFGDLVSVERLADLPEPACARLPVLAVVPYRQIRERGFDAIDDGAPLMALCARERSMIGLADLIAALPDGPGGFTDTGYDVPDEEYRRIVSAVLDQEIAEGAGSNFVIHRCLTGRVEESPARAALGALRRLLIGERRAYWTFAVHTPEATFVGATPERHVSLDGGVARMNPISGTLRYPSAGWGDRDEHLAAVLAFLADPKERDELAMVVDEELKMMAVVGDRGGRVLGPYLKQMAHLAHTEYVLEGHTSLNVHEVLAATMFAPTVTGSPIRNASRVIKRHERRGRRYYGGVLARIGQDDAGGATLDAPILIRTAEIAPDGSVRIAAGATLVRGSHPDSELAETRSKAAAITAAFRPAVASTKVASTKEEYAGSQDHGRSGVGDDPAVLRVLAGRNRTLARFWLEDQAEAGSEAGSAGSVTVIDAEDDFTGMLSHLLDSLGFDVRTIAWDAVGTGAARDGLAADLVVLGPGPGDPRDRTDPRIHALHGLARDRLAAGAPVLGVCLGHQILADTLGLRVARLDRPDQGRQTGIDLFGVHHRVGFYNSYVVLAPGAADAPVPGLTFSLDDAGTRVHAVRGAAITGLQFHPESVLTTDGVRILATELGRLLRAPQKSLVQD